jgi:pSer/pThr/pTyr-binding forkhead associated (FHA) protein
MAEKTCPTCHRKNRANAVFCIYCGTSLAHNIKTQASTMKLEDAVETGALQKESALGSFKTPERGIAIYMTDQAAPVAIIEDPEFIIGRKIADIQTEQFFDLAPYGGYENGISHRHALVRKSATGYEIIDLYSTNGTQINGEQLIPLKPYPLHSGSQIRLGKLKMFAIFALQHS